MKILFSSILFFSLITPSFSAIAENELTLIKKMQLSLDKNNFENVEEIYDLNEEVLSKNWMAQEKLALSFERRNKLKEASEVYRRIITNFNLNQHKKILESTQLPLDPNLYTTNKLPLYYYKLAFLNAQLFVSSNKYMPEGERLKYKKNTEGYISLLKKVKADEGEIKMVEDLINEKIKTQDLLTYKPNWYVFMDIISWQDRVYLKNVSTGIKSNLLSTAIGSSIGAGRKWSNSRYEFNIEGMYSKATATISNDGDGVTYLQSSAPVSSFIAGPGMYYKGFSDKVFIGIQLPFSYRFGNWQLPPGYIFENDKQFGAGYFFQVKFAVGKFAVESRLGKIFPNPGSHWAIGAIYDF